MNVKALIVEQLEIDGNLRTLRMVPRDRKALIVAFSDEYEEPRDGRFHFLDSFYGKLFKRSFARANKRRLGENRFEFNGKSGRFFTSWMGIPTERYELTYYALSLPELCVLDSISIKDPHSNRQYKRCIKRDDYRKRLNLYMECKSSRGEFDFELEINFHLDPSGFYSFDYKDDHTKEYGKQINNYVEYLKETEIKKVQNFFGGTQYNAPIIQSAIASNSPGATQTVTVNPGLENLLDNILETAERDEQVTKADLLMVQKEIYLLRNELMKPTPKRSVIERSLGNLGSIASLVSIVDRIAPFLPILY